MRVQRSIHALGALLAVATGLFAEAREKPSNDRIRSAQQLFGVMWEPSLAAASKKAQNARAEKAVLVLRVLGDLDDKL